MTYMNKKYAINEKKQAELDTLTSQVSKAQFQVDQLQSIVSSLTQKNTDFSTSLTNAQNNRETALSNLNRVNQVITGIKDMVRNANLVRDLTKAADSKISDTAKQLALVINQLIFSVEIIDKLALLINKKKASGRIVSNELVTMITSATANANNAVATTLTALSSCYVSMDSSKEAYEITELEFRQSIDLYSRISGDKEGVAQLMDLLNSVQDAQQEVLAAKQEAVIAGANIQQAENQSGDDSFLSMVKEGLERLENALHHEVANHQNNLLATVQNKLKVANTKFAGAQLKFQSAAAAFNGRSAVKSDSLDKASLYALLVDANDEAKSKYDDALKASSMVGKELAQAEAKLTNATVKLNSLKSGLTAAIAAAMAA